MLTIQFCASCGRVNLIARTAEWSRADHSGASDLCEAIAAEEDGAAALLPAAHRLRRLPVAVRRRMAEGARVALPQADPSPDQPPRDEEK